MWLWGGVWGGGGVVGVFFFNDTATTEIYTLSLHDALPICWGTGWKSIKIGQLECKMNYNYNTDDKLEKLLGGRNNFIFILNPDVHHQWNYKNKLCSRARRLTNAPLICKKFYIDSKQRWEDWFWLVFSTLTSAEIDSPARSILEFEAWRHHQPTPDKSLISISVEVVLWSLPVRVKTWKLGHVSVSALTVKVYGHIHR